MEKLILKMQKGQSSSTIECKDKDHYDRLVKRYEKRGYKQVTYKEEIKNETYPF